MSFYFKHFRSLDGIYKPVISNVLMENKILRLLSENTNNFGFIYELGFWLLIGALILIVIFLKRFGESKNDE
jgi:hypothetical protein